MGETIMLRLVDGRLLETIARGPESERAVLCHHGTPSDALGWADWTPAVEAHGLRLVAFDRPGYGSSSRAPGRTIADVAADAAEVLAQLGVAETVTIGASGGGPHALACAALLGGCRAAATLAGVGPYGAPDLDFLAGMGPENVEEFGLALAGEPVLREWMDRVGVHFRTVPVAEVSEAIGGLLPEVDRVPAYLEHAVAGMHRGLARGCDGWIDDDLAFTQPWGFEVGSISVPVAIWQGDLDLMVPEAHGDWLAAHLPTAELHRAPGEGHLSLPFRYRERILESLLRAAGWA